MARPIGRFFSLSFSNVTANYVTGLDLGVHEWFAEQLQHSGGGPAPFVHITAGAERVRCSDRTQVGGFVVSGIPSVSWPLSR